MVSYKILMEVGFTEKEAQIYLACLELGEATVLQISRKAKVSRGSCYDLLEIMLKRGYVSRIDKGKHVAFLPIDPEVLMKNKEQALRGFEMALPELKGLFSKQATPKVRYFEGIDGIKQVYLDTLTASTEILNYSNSAEIRKHWLAYDEEYVDARIRKGIWLKGIAPNDEHGRRVQKKDQKSLRELRLVPPREFKFTNEINIYDNKVAITSFQGEFIGILIESKEIADTQRDIFKMAWAFAGVK